jgi:PEGA domain-containing protein
MVSTVRRTLAFAVSLALVAPPAATLRAPAAHAQAKTPLKNQLTGAAKEHFETGLRLSTRKDWNGARTSFQAAYDASHDPRVLFNVAICERQLGHYGAAVQTFRRQLSEAAGKLTKAEEAEITAVIASLEKLLASLTVEANEAGADVYVDSEKVGVTPLKLPLLVPVGERLVRVSKPGYVDATESIQLAAGAMGKVTLKLAPLVKTALVNVSVVGPANATVTVDGKEVGPAPFSGRVTVSPEPHQFAAVAPGYLSATKSIVVTELPEGEAFNVRLEPAGEQRMGRLLVKASPEGATIEIDGKAVGATRWEGPVTAAPHQIVVKKRGYYAFSYDVEVPRGGERAVTASLNEDRNTNFVPWLIGTVVVLGATTAAAVLIASKPDQSPTAGSLPPYNVGTQGFRF